MDLQSYLIEDLMNLQFTLAARYLLGRKLRTALTTLAIVFGVLLVFGMNTVLPTLLAALQANVQGAEGNVDFTITNISGQSFPENLVAPLLKLEGVRAVSGSLNRTVNLPANFVDHDPGRPDRLIVVNLVGIVPEQARSLRAYPVVEGRYLKASDTNAAVISQTLADAFSVDIGDILSLPTSNGVTKLTVVGLLPGNISNSTEEVLVNLPQAQAMTSEAGKINLISLNVEAFAGEARRAEIQAEITNTLGSHYRVGSLMSGQDMFASLQLAQIALSMFGVLALFMGAFIIFNTFRTVVAERRREIGLLRALGATRRIVIGIVLAEGVLQGLVGSMIGLVLGYLMAVGVLKFAQGPIGQFINLTLGMPVVSPSLVLISLLLGVGMTVLAGLLPAWNASRITPMEALRPTQAEAEFKQQTGISFFVGVALLLLTTTAILSGRPFLILPGSILFLAGLVLVAPALVRPFASLFGRLVELVTIRTGIGNLAQSNLTRQPSRVAVTASASMLGLAVIVAAGALISSMFGMIFGMVKDSLGSDYLFIPPSVGLWGDDIGASPAFAENLRQIDGVGIVNTQRFATSSVNGKAVSLLGIDPVTFPKVSGLYFSQGNASAYDRIANERGMIVNSSFALATGAKIGDTFELLTADGSVPYRVVAVASDLLNAKFTTAYISQSNLQADFDSADDIFIQLNLKEDVDRTAVGKQIKELAAAYPQFKVISGTDYYDSMKAMADAAFSAVYILFAILAFPSLIAMLNTLTIGVLERTREIGMIRAVGGTRKQIRDIVVIEALLLAAIGTIFGITGGLYLGYALVTGIRVVFPMGYYFPLTGILAAVAIGLLFGVIAAIIPARQAARLEIVRALRYE
jgi:putative ABC transport system permease protein